MSGGTLKELLRGGNRSDLGWSKKNDLASDVARGMVYIHGLGHIHRDMKSGNILITETMHAKVADFGSVGQWLVEARTQRLNTQLSMSSVTSFDGHRESREMTRGVGTPLYMSLEMLLQESYNSSTDVWSFGVLLWEIAAQTSPDLLEQEGHKKGPVFSNLIRFLDEGRRLTIDTSWPEVWCTLMSRCWGREPSVRPSFAQILSELEGSSG